MYAIYDYVTLTILIPVKSPKLSNDISVQYIS